jgi:hypothetical protein
LDERRMKQRSFLTQGNLSHIKPLKLWVSSTTYFWNSPKSSFLCKNSNDKPKTQVDLETHCNKLNKRAHEHTHTQTQKIKENGNIHFTKQLGRKNTQITERQVHVTTYTPWGIKGAHYIWKDPTRSSGVARWGTFCPRTQGINVIATTIIKKIDKISTISFHFFCFWEFESYFKLLIYL